MRLLEDGELAPAELGALAVAAHEQRDERHQRVGVAPLGLDVDELGRVAALDDRRGELVGRRGREAAVLGRRPLHRRAHGHPAGDVEVLPHADLLAVEQHRRAGQREQQAVDHAHPARVAAEHRGQAPAQAAAVHLHVLVGAEGGEDLLPLVVAQLVEGELVVVADERRPLAVGRDRRARRERLGERRGVLPGQRQVQPLHRDEVELHRQLVAVGAAEERLLLLVGQVDLAEQDAVAAAAAEERPQVAQVGVGVGEDLLGVVDAVRGEEERHGVDPEARQPQLEPEAHDLRDLVADLRVGDVEVGLVLVELVQVVLPGLLVVLPDAVLLVGEDDLLLLGRRLVAPDVEVAVGRVLALAGALEPRVLVAGVVDDEVGDDPHAAVLGGADDLDEVAEAAEPPVDAVEVDDVVAVVAVGRRVDGHQPQAGDAERRQVVEPLREALQVTGAVAVGVEVGLDVEAVDDRRLPPQVGGVGEPHAAATFGVTSSCGRTFSPNTSSHGRCSWPTWWR